jgi:hypothetical protein
MLAIAAHLAFVTATHRQSRPWILRRCAELAGALGCGFAALTLASRGWPPWPAAVAASAGAMALVVAGRPVERWIRWAPWWSRWLGAALVLTALAIAGPWWSPLPTP